MLPLLYLMAQINPDKISGMGEPSLDAEYSYGLAWALGAALLVAALLITFKTSKRNAMDRD